MSSRELYEFALIELNKLQAPSLLLEDYVYFINKAIQQYANLAYNKYDVNQQSTDDLRVLRTTCELNLTKLSNITDNDLYGIGYYTYLPKDYVHLLNCIVEYRSTGYGSCDTQNNLIHYTAKRLTSDMFGGIVSNAYLCPSYKRPYYIINNFNSKTDNVTNPDIDSEIINYNKDGKMWNSENSESLVNNSNISGSRLANASKILLEIRCGKDNKRFIPEKVYVDYIKAPMYINLTLEDINNVVDKTPIIEFPNYVCFEIINTFVRLVMENSSDPRLQTNPIINQTIDSQQISRGK